MWLYIWHLCCWHYLGGACVGSCLCFKVLSSLSGPVPHWWFCCSLMMLLSCFRSFQAALHHFCTNVWIKHENCQTVCCDCFWCFCVQTGIKEIKVMLISGCDSEMISIFQQLSGQQRDNRADKSSLKQVSRDSLAHWQLHEWRSQLNVKKSSCVCNKAWVCEERTCSTPADGC